MSWEKCIDTRLCDDHRKLLCDGFFVCFQFFFHLFFVSNPTSCTRNTSMSSISAETKEDCSNEPGQRDDSDDDNQDQQDDSSDDDEIADPRHVLLYVPIIIESGMRNISFCLFFFFTRHFDGDGGSSSLYLVPYNAYETNQGSSKDPYWHEKYCVYPFNGTFEIPEGVRIVKFEEI